MTEVFAKSRRTLFAMFGLLNVAYIYSVLFFFPLGWIGTHATDLDRNIILSFVACVVLLVVAAKLAIGLRTISNTEHERSLATLGVILACVGVIWAALTHGAVWLVMQSV